MQYSYSMNTQTKDASVALAESSGEYFDMEYILAGHPMTPENMRIASEVLKIRGGHFDIPLAKAIKRAKHNLRLP